MKVLFASLSRIGDYIQHMLVVRAWSQKHPDVEVHILVNDLIPDDLMRMNAQYKHIVFPRFEYQRKINQVATPLMYPFLSLRKVVQQLRTESYDRLFDLSLQTQSAAFLRLIDEQFKYSPLEMKLIHQYLNVNDSTHLVDILKHAYDLDLHPRASIAGKTKRVLFQVTTSDEKKNIDLPRWIPLVESLRTNFRSLEILVLGSYQEQKKLRTIFKKTELLACSFAELSHFLDDETKLVSLDTSIKHFAAWFQVPTVEISVGSSHYLKNAAYQTGNYIFSADFHCRPCGHSGACPLGRNQCQDQIEFEDLNYFLSDWIQNSLSSAYSYKTWNQNGNLSMKRGEQWNQRTKQVSPSL